jgi:ATP-dependent DNA ligase
VRLYSRNAYDWTVRLTGIAAAAERINTEAGILFNEHIAEDGPTVFAHACRLGAEGIVSKRVDGTYRSGPYRVWIKVRNPASIAVQRERSEIWNR